MIYTTTVGLLGDISVAGLCNYTCFETEIKQLTDTLMKKFEVKLLATGEISACDLTYWREEFTQLDSDDITAIYRGSCAFLRVAEHLERLTNASVAVVRVTH